MKVKNFAVIWFVFLVSLHCVNSASAESVGAMQNPATSACTISTKGMAKNEKDLTDLKCKLEKEEVKKQIREAQKLTTRNLIAADAPIGAVADNKAVTTITKRSEKKTLEDGTVIESEEASKDWGKHEEKMEKAKHPSSPCFWVNNYCGFGQNGGQYGAYNNTSYQTTTSVTLGAGVGFRRAGR